MKNVKELLKRWKYELAEEEMSCTTDWAEEQFEAMGTMIEELEEGTQVLQTIKLIRQISLQPALSLVNMAFSLVTTLCT